LQPVELIALSQMQFKISQYEFKDFTSDDWQKVSEKFVLGKLVDVFDLITPSLSKMIQGNEIITPEGIFRLKNCGNVGKDE
jgi:hypothetical protein